jgi:hypothetical protein
LQPGIIGKGAVAQRDFFIKREAQSFGERRRPHPYAFDSLAQPVDSKSGRCACGGLDDEGAVT